MRRRAYERGWLNRHSVGAPVIVVGNMDVGGNGKTPVVIALAGLLADNGWRVGVVARGYGGLARDYPLDVTPDTDPGCSGDEAVLVAKRTPATVVVDPDRVRGARRLAAKFKVDVVLADDGLQHLRMVRDFEIALVDGERGLGNGFCLPAGPLREPAAALASVDRVLRQGPEQEFQLAAGRAQNMASWECRALEDFQGIRLSGLAGIAWPERFFSMLEDAGLDFTPYCPGDHAPPPRSLVEDSRDTVLMTEKDAVKWPAGEAHRAWVVAVDARFMPPVQDELIAAIEVVIGNDRD